MELSFLKKIIKTARLSWKEEDYSLIKKLRALPPNLRDSKVEAIKKKKTRSCWPFLNFLYAPVKNEWLIFPLPPYHSGAFALGWKDICNLLFLEITFIVEYSNIDSS